MKKLSKKTLQTIEDGQEQVENDEGRTLQQVKEELESLTKHIHDKADDDREKHISLEEYGRKRGLE
ncbi:MAG: hypothetical protein ACQESD_07195 [Thermoplasmatota archaeon]